ncbi:MAG TPA: recombinase family protein [Myxococcales bacterium]|jgi:DNA invertase Pin-like site-specific DNA recombinase
MPTPTAARPRRVVLLGRVSRGERQQDPEGQLAPLRAAAARLGWIVVREVALKLSAWDESTAAEVHRQALAPIEAGEADTLAIWSWDRFSREGIEGAFGLLRHLEEHLGAQLYSLQEPFLSTATADRQQRELMLSLAAWTARWESERKSQRLRAKVASKRIHAAALGQRARWGRGQLPSEADAAQVRALRSEGRTVREIAATVGLSRATIGRMVQGCVSPQAEGQATGS